MSSTFDGGPAFPRVAQRVVLSSGEVEYHDGQDGMSLRDYFAGQALQGFWAHLALAGNTPMWKPDAVARAAYDLADALLKAREAR